MAYNYPNNPGPYQNGPNPYNNYGNNPYQSPQGSDPYSNYYGNNPNPAPGYNPYANPYANPYQAQMAQVATSQQSIFSRVYMWMFAGLLITGATAVFTVQTEELLRLVLGNSIVFFGLLLAELALVFVISSALRSMAASTATALFVVYAALNGLTLSVIFLLYTRESIASTFFITGATFGVMSLYGYLTKQDLSKVGNIAMMGLIGIILASIVNLFLHSSGLYWIITYVGILVFVGLTAWDTQKIKRWTASVNPADLENVQRFAILGALELYLDFINLFLLLLRIFGRRR